MCIEIAKDKGLNNGVSDNATCNELEETINYNAEIMTNSMVNKVTDDCILTEQLSKVVDTRMQVDERGEENETENAQTKED